MNISIKDTSAILEAIKVSQSNNVIDIDTREVSWEDVKHNIKQIIDEVAKVHKLMVITSTFNSDEIRNKGVMVLHTNQVSDAALRMAGSNCVVLVDVSSKARLEDLKETGALILNIKRESNCRCNYVESNQCETPKERIEMAINRAVKELNNNKKVLFISRDLSCTAVYKMIVDKISNIDNLMIASCGLDAELMIRNTAAEDSVVILDCYDLNTKDIQASCTLISYTDKTVSKAKYIVARAVGYTKSCDGFRYGWYRAVEAESARQAIDLYVSRMNCGYIGVTCIGTDHCNIYDDLNS